MSPSHHDLWCDGFVLFKRWLMSLHRMNDLIANPGEAGLEVIQTGYDPSHVAVDKPKLPQSKRMKVVARKTQKEKNRSQAADLQRRDRAILTLR
jgi:hypothetical protein